MGIFDFLKKKEKPKPYPMEMHSLAKDATKFGGAKEWEKCITTMNEVPPENMTISDWWTLGYAYSNTGDLQSALLAWEKSLRGNLLMDTSFYKGVQNESIAEIILVLLGGQKANTLPMVNCATLYNYSWALFNLKRYQEALWCLDYVLRFTPKDTDALYLRGRLGGMQLTNSPKTPLEASMILSAWKEWQKQRHE